MFLGPGGGEDPLSAWRSGRRRAAAGVLRLPDLVGSLPETKGLRRRLRPTPLCWWWTRYLPVTRNGATLFFQLINERYERASTVLTSNKGFEEWGTILGDEVMAAALLDRLLHHCHIVNRTDPAARRPYRTGTPNKSQLPKRRRPGEAVRASGADLRSLRSLRPRPTRPSRNSPPAAYRPEALQIPSTHPSAGPDHPEVGHFRSPKVQPHRHRTPCSRPALSTGPPSADPRYRPDLLQPTPVIDRTSSSRRPLSTGPRPADARYRPDLVQPTLDIDRTSPNRRSLSTGPRPADARYRPDLLSFAMSLRQSRHACATSRPTASASARRARTTGFPVARRTACSSGPL